MDKEKKAFSYSTKPAQVISSVEFHLWKLWKRGGLLMAVTPAEQSALLRKLRSGEIELLKTADLATGELSIEDDTDRAFRVLTECANPSWRVSTLKRYDLNADEFCEAKPGRMTIQFTGNLEGGDQ